PIYTRSYYCLSFVYNAPATPAIYTLSLHDALPICSRAQVSARMIARSRGALCSPMGNTPFCASAREERNRYADQGAQRRSGPRGSPHSLLKAIHARFQVFHCLGCPVVGQPLIKTHNQLMERT